MPPKNNPEKKTQQKQNKPKQRAYYVCDGGTCTCAGAVSPAPISLKVTSHKKYYILGGKKLVATDKDKSIENLNFSTCKNVPKNQSPQPCKAKIEWTKFYPSVKYDGDKHPLIETSEGKCMGYTGTASKIKIANHGQTGHASQKQIDAQSIEPFRGMMQLLLPAEDILEKEDAPEVTGITLQANAAWNMTGPLQSSKGHEDSIAKIILETPGQNQKLFFTAGFKSGQGNPKSISWITYTCKAGEKEPSFDQVDRAYMEYGPNFSVDISRNYKGIFRVEAYGFSAQDKRCCIDVQLRPNEVKEIHGPVAKNGAKNTRIAFESGLLFEPGKPGSCNDLQWSQANPLADRATLHWTIESLSPMQLLYNLAGINNPVVDIKTDAVKQGAIITTFFQEGQYKVTAKNDATSSSKTFELTIEKKLEVMEISHNAINYMRRNDRIACAITRFNVKGLSIQNLNQNTIEWRLYNASNPNNLQHVGILSDFKRLPSMAITPQELQRLFPSQIPQDAKGKYVIEAFGESLTEQSLVLHGNKIGAAQYYFEVTDNRVVGKPTGPSQVPQDATGTFSVQTLMPLTQQEKTSFHWDVKSSTGPQAVVDSSTAQTQQVKIKFPQLLPPGNNNSDTHPLPPATDYTITCHMVINGINTGISEELTVHAATLKLRSASWCFDDGYKRTQTGYNEECYAYVELESLTNATCKLQVWALVDDRTLADVVKLPRHLLQETDVTLTADENRHPPTAHAYVAFKVDKSRYENLFKDLMIEVNKSPNVRLAYTISLNGGEGININAEAEIIGTKKLTAATKIYYSLLDNEQHYLQLTDIKSIKALYFTNDKHSIQNEITYYGKNHPVKVHTVNMVGDKLTVKIFRENLDYMLSDSYNAQNKTIVVANEEKVYADQMIGESGTLKLDFVLTEELKGRHLTELIRVFVVEVYTKTKNANGDETENIVASQYELRGALPFETVRNETQVGIEILIDKPATDDESLKQYKHQYASIPNALRVAKQENTKDPEPSPTFVDFEDMDVEEEGENQIIFPLLSKPENDISNKWGSRFYWGAPRTKNMATFQANRDGGRRKHAARDLYTNPLTTVVAIAKGVVLDVRSFYCETSQVTIRHTLNDGRDFIIRYGELDPKSISVRIGQEIKQKDELGKTGKLLKYNKNTDQNTALLVIDGTVVYMLHFEYFSAALGFDIQTAPLTNGNKPFARRNDLEDSIAILIEGYRNSFTEAKTLAKDQNRHSVSDLSTSTDGIEFIKGWEDFYANMYSKDGGPDGGNCTIGYGTLIHLGPCNGNPSEEKFKSGVTKEEATIILKNEIKEIEYEIKREILVPLYQHEFDALVSLLYNIGKNGLSFKAPKLKLKLNARQYEKAASEFLDITSSGITGLVKRRNAENGMFLTGIYDSTH